MRPGHTLLLQVALGRTRQQVTLLLGHRDNLVHCHLLDLLRRGSLVWRWSAHVSDTGHVVRVGPVCIGQRRAAVKLLKARTQIGPAREPFALLP